MKTLKLIAPMLFMLTLLYSCTTEEYYEDNGYKEQWYSGEVLIKSNEWELKGGVDELGSYYESIVYIRELDSQFYSGNTPYYEGIITVGMYSDYKQNTELQLPLPHTIYKVDLSTTPETYYSVQYSYDLQSNGTIAFKIYVSDYYTGSYSPETTYFKVTAIW